MGKTKSRKVARKNYGEFDAVIKSFYPQSSVAHLVVSVTLVVLIWMSLRLWWMFQPIWFLPAILGLLLPIVVKREDLFVVSLTSSVASAVLFPLIGQPLELVIIISIIVMFTVSMLVLSVMDNEWRKYIPYLVLASILIGFFAHASAYQRTPNQQGVSLIDRINYNPPAESYGFDAFIFTKTFYLMKEGNDYYSAFKQANIDDGRISQAPNEAIYWRLPFLFSIWTLIFANGAQICIGFLILAVITAIFGFLIGREISSDGFAILPASLICGYFMYGATSIWLPFAEYWGLGFSFIAAFLFIRGSTIPSAVSSVLALLVRQVYIFMFIGEFIGDVVDKRFRKIPVWVISGLVFAIVYQLHISRLKAIVPGIGTAMRIETSGGLQLVIDSIKFSTPYLVMSPDASILLYIFGLLGLCFAPSLRNKIFLVIAALVPLIVFNFLGNQWNYYWGPVFMPFALLGFAPALAAVEKLLDILTGKVRHGVFGMQVSR